LPCGGKKLVSFTNMNSLILGGHCRAPLSLHRHRWVLVHHAFLSRTDPLHPPPPRFPLLPGGFTAKTTPESIMGCIVRVQRGGFGTQVLAVDALRQERVVSCGHDHTCRVWKIAEESQLIYRGHATAVDCCR